MPKVEASQHQRANYGYSEQHRPFATFSTFLCEQRKNNFSPDRRRTLQVHSVLTSKDRNKGCNDTGEQQQGVQYLGQEFVAVRTVVVRLHEIPRTLYGTHGSKGGIFGQAI